MKVAPNLTVGYIMGAGDEVPASLQQLGVKVEMLSAKDLASGELSRYSAIITGIRAYNVNEDLKANNQRLLQYVEQGGTLIVQYNTPAGRGDSEFPVCSASDEQLGRRSDYGRGLAGENPQPAASDSIHSKQDHAGGFRGVGTGARTLLHDPVGQQIYTADLGK